MCNRHNICYIYTSNVCEDNTAYYGQSSQSVYTQALEHQKLYEKKGTEFGVKT